MPLSSNLAVDKLKLSNTAGVTGFNTGSNSLAYFNPKLKTSFTFRNLFGDCPWAPGAATGAFTDYIQVIDRNDLYTGNTQAFDYNGNELYAFALLYIPTIGDGIIDFITGAPVYDIVAFLDGNFASDIGNVPIPDSGNYGTGSCYTVTVQSELPNTAITLQNGNRARNVLSF